MSKSLVFKAGPGALRTVREEGFAAERIGTIAGASGGAKWLVLSQLDRAILDTIVPGLQGPVHLIGSSIGAWRFACYAQKRPIQAIERFEMAYLEQSYSADPDIHEITEKSREILGFLFRDHGAEQVLSHPVMRLNVLAVRAKHLTASERPLLLGAGLAAAATLNLIARRSLGLFFERVLFYDDRDKPPFLNMKGLPLQQVALSAGNLKDVVVASGSIPMVLTGVRDIAGAKRGVYRDGGVIDYHLDIPQSQPDKLTLFPHFYSHITPGWFDKKLPWRRPRAEHIDRTILVSPSPEFIASLPLSKIPDRTDFVNFSSLERTRNWRTVVKACEQMADEFREVIEKDQLAARLQPL